MNKRITISFLFLFALFYFGGKAWSQDSTNTDNNSGAVTDDASGNTTDDSSGTMTDDAAGGAGTDTMGGGMGDTMGGGMDDAMGNPARPEVERPDILPGDLLDKVEDYRTEKRNLRTELRERLADLDNPTREEVRDEVNAFRDENAERIDAQKELAHEIRTGLHEIRKDRMDRGRPILTPELVRMRNDFVAEREAMMIERRDFINSLKDLPAEERESAIHDFREEHRQRLEEQKELRRQLRDDIKDNLESDRRPDDAG